MNPVGRWLERLVFPVMAPTRLACARIVTGLYAMAYISSTGANLVKNATGVRGTFAPVGLAAMLDAPLDLTTYRSCVVITQVLSFGFVLGFWHRIVAPIFAVLFLFVLSYSNSWSMVFHTENMLALHVLVLAFTPSAAVLSMDAWDRDEKKSAWLARAESLACARPDSEPRWIYGWSIVMMQLVATLPYVVAGLAKVLGKAGIGWALGHSLRDQITMNGIYYEMLMGGTDEITFHVYGYETAFLFAATMTLVLELGAPLALLHRYIGYVWVAGIMGMHWSILVLMGIPFRYQMYAAAFVCFLPVELLVDRVPALIGRFRRATPAQKADSG